MHTAMFTMAALGRIVSQVAGRRFFSLAVSLCFVSVTALAQNFQVQGTRILDPNGNEFIPRGANIGLWSDQSDANNVNYFKNHWKFNTARVYTKLAGDANNYPSDAFMDKYVNAYTTSSNGPKAVVMFECHDFSGGFYTSTTSPSLDDLVNFWKRAATRYKNNPYVWFNIMNEPGGGADVATTPWYNMHKTVIDAIRSVGANNIIVCDGTAFGTEDGGNETYNVPTAKSAVLTYGQQLLNDDPAHNIVYSYHIYQGWRAGGVPKMADYLNRVQALGLAIFVGEFSSGNAGNGWDVTDAAITMWNTIVSRKIGWLFWHWNTGDNTRLTTSSSSGQGINKTDGTRPTNMTYAGERMWDATHGISRNLGTPLNRHGWTVTASNASTNYPTQNAVDGDLNTSYGSGANLAAGMWVDIDLAGAPRDFNRVVLANAGDDQQYIRGYKILVRNTTSEAWTQVASGTNAQSDLNVLFTQQNKRYIRIEATSANTRWWSIREIFVYNTGTESTFLNNYFKVNGALDRTGWTASSSHITNDSPAKAIDGNNGTRFSTGTGPQPGQWFSVDMKASKTFNKILLHTGTSDPSASYRVFASDDGVNWGNAFAWGRWNNYVYTLGGCQNEYISFPTKTARYIKIELTGTKPGTWWSFHEFYVYNVNYSAAREAVASAETSLEEANSLSITPNPVVSETRITLPATRGNREYLVEVLDMQGQVVLSRTVKTTGKGEMSLPLTLQKLSSGIYTVRITGDQGYRASKRLVKVQ